MDLQAARCPSCSGEIQLDPTKETGFCMHCGSKVLVKEAIQKIRIDSDHLIKNYIKIARSAFERGDYSEAYNYYTKIIEINPDYSWEPYHYRSLAAGYLSISKFLLKNTIQGTTKALSMIASVTEDQRKINYYREKFAKEIFDMLEVLRELNRKNYFTDHDTYVKVCVHLSDCYDYILALIDTVGINNKPKFNDLKLRILKSAHMCLMPCLKGHGINNPSTTVSKYET